MSSSYRVAQRTREGEVRKGQYYVHYLGWKECRGLAGREYTEPIVKDLVHRRRNEPLPKLTIEVSRKELKIFQMVKGKFGRTDKFKFPTVPAKDVTYAVQGLPPDADVVACIYLGFNTTTRKAVHVHAYRCDSPHTAALLVDNLMDILRMPEHQNRLDAVEEQLVAAGEVIPRPRNFVKMYDMESVISTTPSTVHTNPDNLDNMSDDDTDSARTPDNRHSGLIEEDFFEKEKERNMESLANELKLRLGSRTQVPILLPPQDYDTVRRIRGNLDLQDPDEYQDRKCKNEDIVGSKGAGVTSAESKLKALYINNNENKGSGSSDGRSDSSRGNSQGNFSPPELRSKGPYGSGSRHSRDSRGSTGERDIQVVTPHWKTGVQIYSPPGRPISPHPYTSNDNNDMSNAGTSGHRRARSPSPRQNYNPPRRHSSPPPGMVAPGSYSDNRRGRSPTSRQEGAPRRRSGSRGRYIDAPQGINAYPSGNAMPYDGRGNYSKNSHGSDIVRNVGRQPPHDDPYSLQNRMGGPADLSASMPESILRSYSQPGRDKSKGKKDKKKAKRNSEPTPDYTMHPGAGRKMPGQVYS